ncbi:hypothetical protein A1D31_11780 [Bradyrhizobium liaoningense]|nr:hypothetical protein A1D31_11780 [Bradyrhizobium liaoningense]
MRGPSDKRFQLFGVFTFPAPGDLLQRFCLPSFESCSGTGNVPGGTYGRIRPVYSRNRRANCSNGRAAWGLGRSDHAALGALAFGARTNVAGASVAMAASPVVLAGLVASCAKTVGSPGCAGAGLARNLTEGRAEGAWCAAFDAANLSRLSLASFASRFAVAALHARHCRLKWPGFVDFASFVFSGVYAWPLGQCVLLDWKPLQVITLRALWLGGSTVRHVVDPGR